jgi:ubiquitin-like domain-containing CTD phosphatase 1
MGLRNRVFDFRNKILELTNVPFARQKLVGLLKGASKITEEMDATRFGSLGVKDGVVKFTMIGTPEAQSFKDPIPRPDVSLPVRMIVDTRCTHT